ncbi:MAG TPA: amylo-alpha-1,6-glucosidase [Ktedonobacterales bacterium]|jgi:glycogen debranching enzyme
MESHAVPSHAHDAGPLRHHVIPRPRHLEELPAYFVPDTDLEMGASLGNTCCWVTTKGSGDVESLFSRHLGKTVVGSICLRYSGVGHRIIRPGRHEEAADPPVPPPSLAANQSASPQASDASTTNEEAIPLPGIPPQAQQYALHDEPTTAFIHLRQEMGGQFEIHPAYQRHLYDLSGSLKAEETVFVPHVAAPAQARHHPDLEAPLLYHIVALHNHATLTRRLRIYGYARLRGATPADITSAYDPDLCQGALIAKNASQPDWVRVFGISGRTVHVSGWETTFDASQIYETTHVFPLDNDTAATGDVLGALQVDVDLEPGERVEFAFITAFSSQGEAAARQTFDHAWNYERALRETTRYYTRAIGVTEVMTPDPIINQGVTWAKVNMLRVMSDYPTGPAFTNDPSRSSAVVGRDAAWFVYGCDHLLPEFSRRLLDAFAQRQQPSGKIIEYYHAVTNEQFDDGLNINDDTPLFILAVNHHYRETGDDAYLRQMYPAVRRAARYILSQRDTELPAIPADQKYGLVVCTARGTSVEGICGWRNIIEGYTLNGAVTEVNAECAAALRAAAHLGAEVGTRQGQQDASDFRQAAEALTAAINVNLLNPETGLYYLTIDLDGNRRTDVTSDELFPVIFRVAPDDVSYRIISRLNSPDFWTPAGIRTVSRDSPDYDPYGQYGLMGGVWPGVTWWYAFAAKAYHPEFMVRALRASFEHYLRDPKKNNTVPGQFSEWIDGESLVNRGMRLSPWEPPRFLWAAVEGVCGVMLGVGPIRLSPLLPRDWHWVGIRRLFYHGRELAFFAARQQDFFHVFCTADCETSEGDTKHVYHQDISEQIYALHALAHHVAFKRPGEIMVCLGSASRQTMLVPLRLDSALEAGKTYHTEVYNSERSAWVEGETSRAEDLKELAVDIEEGGYRLLRFLERP